MADDNIEQQAEEIEVLTSIFLDQFQLISSEPNTCKIHLFPNADGADNHVEVYLCVTMNETYPTSTIPDIKIELIKGLSSSQQDELTSVAINAAEENLGFPSVFTVAEMIKEWLLDNNMPGQDGSMYSEMMRRMQQKDVEQKKQSQKEAINKAADLEFKQEKGKDEIDPHELERIRKRQAGTQVTVESFNKWKKQFDLEMLKKAEENGFKATTVDERPTGKQFFLLHGNDYNDDEGEDDDDEDWEEEGEESESDGEEDLDDNVFKFGKEDASKNKNSNKSEKNSKKSSGK